MLIADLNIIFDGVEKSFGKGAVSEAILDGAICLVYSKSICSLKARGDENPEASALLFLDFYFNADQIGTKISSNNDADLYHMNLFIALVHYWNGDTQNAISIVNRMTIKTINEGFKTKAIELAMPSIKAAERSIHGASNGGNKTGELLKSRGEETKRNVLAQSKRLIESGTDRRDIAGIIAKMYGMPTARHIRTILKEAETKGA